MHKLSKKSIKKLGLNFLSYIKETAINQAKDQTKKYVKDIIFSDKVKKYLKENMSELLSSSTSLLVASPLSLIGGAAAGAILLGLASYCGYRKYINRKIAIDDKSREAFHNLINNINNSGLTIKSY